MKNAKTMFKVMNEFKKVEPVTNNKNQAILNNNNISENVEKIEVITKKEQTSNNFGPTFFL